MNFKTSITALFGGLPLAVMGVVASTNPAQALLFDGLEGFGEISITGNNLCASNNTIDFVGFRTGSNAYTDVNRPCERDIDGNFGDGLSQFGYLGTGRVSAADGFFNTFPNFGTATDPGLFGARIDLLDIILPGVQLLLTESPQEITDPGGGSINIVNFLRIDANKDGVVGNVGDMTYTVEKFFLSATDAGARGFDITADFQGYFQEIGTVASYGTKDEKIDLIGDRLFTSVAIVSGGISEDPNDLAVVGDNVTPGACNIFTFGSPDGDGTDGTPIDNLNPVGPCATEFSALEGPDAERDNSNTTGSFRVDVPEPGSVAGLMAGALTAVIGLGKRKKS